MHVQLIAPLLAEKVEKSFKCIFVMSDVVMFKMYHMSWQLCRQDKTGKEFPQVNFNVHFLSVSRLEMIAYLCNNGLCS